MTDKKNDDKQKPPPPPAPAVSGTSQQQQQQQQADPLSPEKIKDLISEALNDKLNEYSSHYRDLIKQESEIMQLEIETKWAGFKDTESHRRLLADTDILDLKRRVSKLPADGNLGPLFAEKTLNESLNMTHFNTIGDDSINATFYDRLSVQQKISVTEWVAKDRITAPGCMAYSIVGFIGPADNDNWMNVRETSLTEYEKTLLERIPFIPDRIKSLEPLRRPTRSAPNVATRPSTRNTPNTGTAATATTSAADDDFIKECFIKGQKWDSDFARDAPRWDGRADFDNFFSNLWRVAKTYRICDPILFKDILYQRIYDSRGERLGDLITPERNQALSALSYYLMIRRLVTPFSDPEVASQYFYNLKQETNQPLDTYFENKLRVFKLMNPGLIPKKKWKEFYLNVSKNLLYTNLAMDMANYVESMQFLDDYNAYLNKLINLGQRYVNWDGSGHISKENLSACYSQAMEMFLPKNSAETKKQPIISIIEDNIPTNTAMYKENLTEEPDEVPSWVDHEDDPIAWDQIEGVIGAFNGRSKNIKCWHCNIPGHVVQNCNKKKAGEPPNPESRFGKTRSKFTPRKAPSNSNKIPEQYARKTINQMDQEASEESEIDKYVQAIVKNHVH